MKKLLGYKSGEYGQWVINCILLLVKNSTFRLAVSAIALSSLYIVASGFNDNLWKINWSISVSINCIFIIYSIATVTTWSVFEKTSNIFFETLYGRLSFILKYTSNLKPLANRSWIIFGFIDSFIVKYVKELHTWNMNSDNSSIYLLD